MGFGGGFKGGAGDLGSDLKINDGTIKIKEQANAESDTTAYGQIWVKTATPNQLYFTTDAGDDIQITSGTGLAAASSSSAVNADDIQTGDAAVTIETTSGNITLDAQANNADVIIKVDDAGSAVTAVTFDGSDAGRAVFNGTMTLGSDADGTDREIVFGHSTLKSIMGIDDSADAFVINTDGAFDATLANNSLSLDASHNMIVAGNITGKGRILSDDTTDATSKTDGSLQTDGGLSVAKAIYNGTAATLAADSGVVTIGSTTAATFSAAGLLNINNATEATSTTDGSLQTDGGLSVAKSAVIGDDLDLLSDGAILNFGADKDVTLTHVHDTGLLLASELANAPVFEIRNTNNGGNAGILKFNNTEGSNDGADGDDLGSITFWGNDDGTPSAQQYAGILAEISDASSGAEGGKLSLQVAEHDGTVTTGLLLEDGNANGEIDVTIGAGTSSITTIAGTLELGDRNITNVGDIALDSLSVADAANGLNVDMSAANTGTGVITLRDNMAAALTIKEGSNAYMTFVSTNSGEKITVAKALDLDAAVQLDSTLTVGEDDTGYDVKFFGASASHFLLWDESADELVLAADSKLSFHDAAGDENIVASSNGHLEINSGTTLDMTAPTVDVNASTAVTIDTPGVTITDTTTSSATEGGFIRLVSDDSAAMANDHRLGVIEFAGAEDANSTITVGAKIEAICDDNWSATENGAALVMSTTDANASQSEVLRLDSNKLATFSGAIQANSTVTVGVDDTGYDVKFFGATSGQYLLWDESADELVLAGDTKLSFHDAAGGENIIATSDGHLEINAGATLDCTAPTIDLNASTALTVDGPSIVLANTATNTPVVQVLNTHNGATGGILRFVNDKGGAGADDDVCGTIQFYGDDDAQDNIEFASITAQVADASNGAEGGRLILKVATHDGEAQPGLTIVDGSAEDEVDVTIGNGAASVTTTAGVLKVVGNVIQASDGGSTITMDDDDNVTIAGKIVGPQEIEQASDGGGSCLLIDNDDTDQIALNIDAANIDGNVLQIAADALTTAQGIQLSVDALTSGGGIFVESTSNNLNGGYMGHFKYNGTSTNNNSIIKITNDHASATNTIPIEVDQDSTGPIMKVNYGANGSAIALSVKEVDITLSTSGTSTTTNSFIPAGSVVIGLGVRVITAIDNDGFITNIGIGANGVGVSANKNYFGQASDGVLEEQNDTAVLFPGNIADDGSSLYNVNSFGAATPLVITTNAQPSTGEVRVALYYYQVTPPQSNQESIDG